MHGTECQLSQLVCSYIIVTLFLFYNIEFAKSNNISLIYNISLRMIIGEENI